MLAEKWFDAYCDMTQRNFCREMRNKLDIYCVMVHRNVCGDIKYGIKAYCGIVHRNICEAVSDKLATQKVALQKAGSKLRVSHSFCWEKACSRFDGCDAMGN